MPDGAQLPLESGNLIDFPAPTGLSNSAQQSLKHVEGEAAALMRKHDIEKATLVINYEGGPCPFCTGATPSELGVSELLLPNQELTVFFPTPGGGFGKGVFRGGQKYNLEYWE